MVIKENKPKSIPEKNLYDALKMAEKKYGLKGGFYLNVRTDNKGLFDTAFFANFNTTYSNKSLVKYLNKKLKGTHICKDVKKCLEKHKKQTVYECDLIYVVDGQILAIIELQGPHHRAPYVLGDLTNFINTAISDFVKEDYCANNNILFYEFTTNESSFVENPAELIKLLKNIESNK